MICVKCGQTAPDGLYCALCGAPQQRTRNTRRRGNGQGTVYKLPGGKYIATVTVGWYVDDDGALHRRTRSTVKALKKDAVAALATLKAAPVKRKHRLTFAELYQKWLPTHRAGKSTMDCYRAAYKHFAAVHYDAIEDIDVDDLQECLDNCPNGRRTRENMRALVGLMYKHGIPRRLVPGGLNLADYLTVTGDASAHRASFTEAEIAQIREAVGVVPYADYIYALIYLGYRPSEFLGLDCADYDELRRCFVAGAKTEAGINRTVTVSPKIQPIIDRQIAGRHTGPVFPAPGGGHLDLRNFCTRCFYPALDAIGIDNPMVEVAGGQLRHKYSPHSCRHTFATLLKRVEGADKDKMELIGHASPEMVRYYQDVALDDIRRLTDAI